MAALRSLHNSTQQLHARLMTIHGIIGSAAEEE